MTTSRKTDIATAIAAKLTAIPEIKTVEFVNPKVTFDDVQDNEVPFIQFFDGGETVEHQRQHVKKTWKIFIELVMKSTLTTTITQKDLWDLQKIVELALFNRPNLGVSGVYNLQYISNSTDLHMNEPHFVLTFEIDVLYDDHLVGTC